MAPYDTQAFEDFEFVGANDGGSGAAVLLELARAIAADPLPYATQIAFLDAQSPFVAPGTEAERHRVGTHALARAEDAFSGVHLAVYLNRVGDADLRIARDLLSHRIYREQFWKVARRLGHRDVFPPDAAFESVDIGNRSLSHAGLRRIVSLVDTRFGGGEPPGADAGTAEDKLERCSQESLATAGQVTLAGLELISEWLVRIDLFATDGRVDVIEEADPKPPEEEPTDTGEGATTTDSSE